MSRGKLLARKLLVVAYKIVKAVPFLDVLYIRLLSFYHNNTILRLKPTSIEAYCRENDYSISIIEDETERVIYEPEFFGLGEAKEYTALSPAIYVAELKNVTVIGSSALMVAKDKALTDVCKNDPDGRVLYTAGTILKANKNNFYVEASQDITEQKGLCVNLCGLAASNYFHLTFEILSRFEYLKFLLKDRQYVVLLDDDARKFKQYEDLILQILGTSEIRYVKRGQRIHCEHIIYPSMNIWMPFNVRKKEDFRITDNLISQSAVMNIRNVVLDNEIRTNTTNEKIKIFISRKKTAWSRIINEAEVAKLFIEAGYKIVCTEDLSFREQVELFSSADCIVGASGAALTNVVYSRPNTILGCIIPKEYDFCIYSTIAGLIGCRNIFLNASVKVQSIATSAELWQVDLEECRDYIRKIEEEL